MRQERRGRSERLWGGSWRCCVIVGRWLKGNWVYILSLVLIGGFITSYVITHYRLEVAEKYDILTDLLLVVLALIAAAGYGVYRLVNHLVRENVRSDIRQAESEVWRASCLVFGLIFYTLAEKLDMPEEAKRQMKDEAESYTSRALEDIEISPEVRESNLITAKSNLAYYWACMHEEAGETRWDLKEKAEQFAEEVYSRYLKRSTFFDVPAWLETYAFVKARFARTSEEKTKTREIINGFLQRPELSAFRRDLENSLAFLERH